ncbi:hypothetical protein RHMOL_Rhmol08G0200600 [Rhododendron molle]|uniref:Uncharacterized protein n=1 Tax=Rhododendron molle TaxID=49168 RepID=A0ACC0MSE5_RHOML|nr:hypothetical protein RHMOL_Rhmol08G0200600 [Rhododendron molle]
MPGNEAGDRVHNFFAQDNLSQGQHQSQAVDGSWPGSINFRAGSQTHNGLPNSNSKNYNLGQSDIERGHSSYSIPVSHGGRFTQPAVRPELAKSRPQSQHPNLNGYIHGHHILQTRQNAPKFLGVDLESQNRNITPKGLSIYESKQRDDPENHTTLVRSESCESPVSFDFFGSQQQMNRQQTGIMQSLPPHQPGFNDMQLLQQQGMLRKMQELQRQQQIQQLEAIRQSTPNQISSITEQVSGSNSPTLINGTPVTQITEASNYPWASPAVNGFGLSPEQGQSLSLMGSCPQQRVDQSPHGVPGSSSRGASLQYSHSPSDKPPTRQMTMYSNSFPSNQFTGFPDQVNMQDGSSDSRHGFLGENLLSHSYGQGLDSGMNLETMHGKTGNQVSSLHNVASLDPTEEKILFGDDNTWDAFGGSAIMGLGGSNLLNGTGFSDGFPSLQSGSWSALMQSAVAETSSNDIGLHEEWSGLSSHNTNVSTSLPNDANVNNRYQGFPGLQQSGQRFSYEHSERLQRNSTHRSIQQSSEEGSKLLSRGPLQKPLAEGIQIYGNAAHSVDAETNAKNVSGSWPNQQKVSSFNSGRQQSKPNGHNVGEAVTASRDALSIQHENENKLQHLQSSDRGGHFWKADSVPDSSIGFEHAVFSREDSSLNNLAAIAYSSTARSSQENTQDFSYWKHADSSLKSKGTVESGKFHHHHNKGPQVLELSIKNSDKDSVKMHETEKCDRKENSSDSRGSNICQHTTTGDVREGNWSDGIESQNFPGGKEKSSGQAGRRTPGHRKFQHHPLGNVDEDVEPSCGMEHATHSQTMSQQIPSASCGPNQGYFGHSNFFGHFPKTSSEMEKDIQRNKNWADDTPSRRTLPGFAPSSAPFDRSVRIHEQNKATQSSQNMLELLHKVDESQEHGSSDGSVGPLRQNQSSSQGFSLQLAPPSQRLPIQSHALPSHSSEPTNSSQTLFCITPEMREKGHMWLASDEDQVQSLPFPLETSQGEFKFGGIGMPGPTRITENHKFYQNRLKPSHSSNYVLSNSSTPQDQEDRISQKVVNGPSEYGLNSMELQGFVCQPEKESLRQLVSSGNTELADRMTASQGKESGVKNQSDSSPLDSASTQRDIEAFGRSLKPNGLSHQNYSLLQQMQAMNSTEVEPSNRSLKRLKRADSGLGSGDSKMLSFWGDGNAASQLGSNVPSQDVLPLGRKDSEDYSHSNSAASVKAEHSPISLQMAPSWFNQFGTFKNGQMLPMYNARKDGTANNVEPPFAFGKYSDNLLASKSLELVNDAADSNQVGKIWQSSTPTSLAIEHFSSGQSLVQNVANQSLVVVSPKKRKSATSELLAWHKEVTEGSNSLLTISLAEVDWAKATYRIIDKVEVEAEIIEDGQPVLRPRRRLILTTQLMQQLFLPPPAAILSADASSKYETMAYFVARRALGDACSLNSYFGRDSCVPLGRSKLIGDQSLSEVVADVDGKSSGLHDKCKLSERICGPHLSKVVEAFIDRARKLENEFMSLDKRASILDLRLETQEIEKFSIINRFAKFHGRGQADMADTSSSSDTAANAHRTFPQRYVTAVPVPRNLPERVQCLSL